MDNFTSNRTPTTPARPLSAGWRAPAQPGHQPQHRPQRGNSKDDPHCKPRPKYGPHAALALHSGSRQGAARSGRLVAVRKEEGQGRREGRGENSPQSIRIS